MTTAAQQKKIAARIKALMAKTAENGATEDEALSAMQKARELMDKYGLTEDAIKADADTIAKQTMTRDDFKTFVIKDWLCQPVADYCDCIMWQESKAEYSYFGTEQDRQFAIWLLESLDTFVRNQTIRFMEGKGFAGGKGPWALQKGFMIGCLERIKERLIALTKDRNEKKATDGRALVAVKMALVKQAFGQLGIRLHRANSSTTVGDNSAFAAGQDAGNRANFNRPVNGGGEVRAIAG